MKDVDDFILSLNRNPAFSDKVNDIEVECGNSLYQPTLDRYIAGEDVPFTEVRKVWRNTTQPMCGTSGFFEEFFPECGPSTRRSRRESAYECWLAILRLMGIGSRAHRTSANSLTAMRQHRFCDGERGSLKTSPGSDAVRHISSHAWSWRGSRQRRDNLRKRLPKCHLCD